MWNTIVRLGHWMRIAIGLWVGFTIAAEVKAWRHPDQHAVYPVFAAGARRWLERRAALCTRLLLQSGVRRGDGAAWPGCRTAWAA